MNNVKKSFMWMMAGSIAFVIIVICILAYILQTSFDKLDAADAEMQKVVGTQLLMPTGDTTIVVNYEFVGENYILDNGVKVSRAFIDSRKIDTNAISTPGRITEP